MPIRKLPPLLVNQIAAGEVIERPASVVKELVENSLDAGATRIEINIEDGGKELIRISDNGQGIPADELPLAVHPHATSKITSAEDLAAIHTLGFRGEALASIASVSRMRITSRPQVDGQAVEAGAVLEASGDDITPVRPTSASPGTAIEVRDLFFNTPARRKFMRAASTEFGHISDMVNRIAMMHYHVGFRLTHNGRKSLDLPPENNRAQRAIAILGKELEEGLLEFEQVDLPDRGGSRVWGMAGMPALARATTKFQYVCVNGRPVRDRNLQHAIKEAYRGLIPPDKQPTVAVFIEMDAAAVDVNVHPTKNEVRFRQPSQMHGLVLSAIRQRLLAADLTPSATLHAPAPQPTAHRPYQPFEFASPQASASMPTPPSASTPSAPIPPASTTWTSASLPSSPSSFHRPASAPSASPDSSEPFAASPSPRPSTHDFVNYFRQMDPTQKGFVYREVKKALIDENLNLGDDDDDTPLLEQAQGNATAPAPLRPRDVLQVHKSYVVTQDTDGLLIVDQHALHERVMFEELRQRVLSEGRNLESQRLLMPVVIKAGPSRQALLDELQPLLDRIGIEVSPIGPEAVGVQAFPSFLFDRKVEPEEFLSELLDAAENGDLQVDASTTEEAVLHEVLDMMSCKAAVKAGDQLTQGELSALLAKRDQIERSSNCPHGRPTTIRLTLRDLEKQFKRT